MEVGFLYHRWLDIAISKDLDAIPSGSLFSNTDSSTIIAKPSTVEVREDALRDQHCYHKPHHKRSSDHEFSDLRVLN
jgi:hypothetical protein